MAGIKLLEKKPGNVDFIMNELLRPEVRPYMFDDMVGLGEIGMMVYDPFSFVYGIFEKGLPIPIGTIILSDVRPFRGCEIHAAIFEPKNRNQHKIETAAAMLRQDLILRWNLHYASARILASNVVSHRVAEKMGMVKIGTKPGNIMCNGKYEDVDEYYVVLDGDKLFHLAKEVTNGS